MTATDQDLNIAFERLRHGATNPADKGFSNSVMGKLHRRVLLRKVGGAAIYAAGAAGAVVTLQSAAELIPPSFSPLAQSMLMEHSTAIFTSAFVGLLLIGQTLAILFSD